MLTSTHDTDLSSPLTAEPRPRRGGEVHLDEWVAPEYVDERGFLRAGKLLEWLDVIGVLTASRHCRMPVVTAAVDGAVFGAPIPVGAHARLVASVAYTSARSMGVRVCVHQDARAGAAAPLRAFMTFVAVDERGKAQPIKPFVPETASEVAWFREGTLRREFRQRAVEPTSVSDGLANPGRGGGEPLRLLLRTLKWAGQRLRVPAQGPSRSYVHKIELVRTGKLNFHGTLYGGTLMRWVETSASLSARAYLRGSIARLVGLHGLRFLRPVRPNVFLHVHSIVAHSGGSQVSVLVRVESEDPLTGTTEPVLRGYLTFAPVDGAPVPRLLIATNEARAAFEEVDRLLALQRSVAVEVGGL